MSARYSALPNPRSAQDAEHELNEAFELDNEESDDETHPLQSSPPAHPSAAEPRTPSYSRTPSTRDETSAIPGAYDFERPYDFPPPGSPPPPSARALPNDYGNSNGFLPTFPAGIPVAGPSRPSSFFRRAVGAILPTHYARVATSEPLPSRNVGSGIENDGVFTNVMAKPQPPRRIQTADGDVHLAPEETQKEAPPSYASAQADAVPPYWETTVHAPTGPDGSTDPIIEDLPVGSFWIFCINMFISFFFQFVGFLLTYLLHTSHAAKYGSRVGLGLTLIQFGFYSRSVSSDASPDASGDVAPDPVPTSPDTLPPPPSTDANAMPVITSRDWLSFLFMTLGWFLVLSSVIGFWRVKRWEKSVRTAAAPISPEAIERDLAIRRNIENVFGISFGEDDATQARLREARAQEERLTRDLRAAGLL